MKRKLTDQERIAKAAAEVLADEVKYCPGRLNPKQLEMLRGLSNNKRKAK